MKNKIIFTIIVIMFTSFFLRNSVADAYENKYNQQLSEKNKRVILIDPGHGGIDGGAESKKGTVEKDINLKISLKLRELLKKQGFNVKMTREEDKGLYSDSGTIRKKKLEDLNNRCKMKCDSKCDMFISIHVNMFPKKRYYGPQVWYSDSKNSMNLAHILQEGLRNDLNDDSERIEKPALDLYKILRCTNNIPSVIVECGFLSNEEEEAKLVSDKYQDKIGESLCKSIKKYYYGLED